MTIKRKELLALPVREWSVAGIYDSLYLVPSGKKHDSGYMCIAIVGSKGYKPFEIAAYPDAINWSMPAMDSYELNTDCEYPSGIIHMWSRRCDFIVGAALSSVEIKVVRKADKPSLSI